MGNKQSGRKDRDSPDSLHPQERRRLTDFLAQKKSSARFTDSEVKKLWIDILVPDLMSSYSDFLFKSSYGAKHDIVLEEFIRIYVDIIRGSPSEKAKVITTIIGTKKNSSGKDVITFQCLVKYLTDLMESYFMGLQHKSDECYTSWTHQTNQTHRAIVEEVIKGLCHDLQCEEGDDGCSQVRVDHFEKWLMHCGLVNLLHSYVLGSMYNLSPEQESTMIPLALNPSNKKWSMLLDISHVLYLNSFLPSENKEVWRFLYSVETHGQSYSKFVSCILDQGPLLLVVLTNTDYMFGGFISTNIVLTPKWIGSEKSFLFTLKPSVDIFPATGYNNHYAYFNNLQTTLPNGLGMGGQHGYWGLWIDSHFGVGDCSESCTTFKGYKILDPNKKFTIKSMEVWGVGDPPPSEEGVRKSKDGGKSALDRDPTNTQILEMAGREMHSKGIRDSMGTS